MEQEHGGRTRRALHLADEGGAPPGQLDAPTEGQVRAARRPARTVSVAVTAGSPRRILGKRPDGIVRYSTHSDARISAWPIIRCGTTSTSSAATFWGRNPHEELTWLRANAPVYWDGRVWGIARYDDLKAVSKDPKTFSNAGGIRPDTGPIPMMIDMDDPAALVRGASS